MVQSVGSRMRLSCCKIHKSSSRFRRDTFPTSQFFPLLRRCRLLHGRYRRIASWTPIGSFGIGIGRACSLTAIRVRSSRLARDFLDLKKWFDDDTAEPSLIGDFRTRFQGVDLRRVTKPGSSVYSGVVNLLVLRGARDWMTGTVPQYGDLDDHHIVPKRWGREHGLDTAIDTVLNRTPLTADANRRIIRDHLPNEYIPELVEKSGESTVRATLKSHCISPRLSQFCCGIRSLLRITRHS